MTKGDIYTKEIFERILKEGTLDVNPRPKYKDGTEAHTLSVNHGMCTYAIAFKINKNKTSFLTEYNKKVRFPLTPLQAQPVELS